MRKFFMALLLGLFVVAAVTVLSNLVVDNPLPETYQTVVSNSEPDTNIYKGTLEAPIEGYNPIPDLASNKLIEKNKLFTANMHNTSIPCPHRANAATCPICTGEWPTAEEIAALLEEG